MNAPEKLFLPDVQSSPDERQIVIQKVGVKSIRHPIQIQLSNGPQATIAQIDINKLIERTKKNPKMHIWIGAYNLLTSIVEMEGYSDYLKYEKANKFLYENDED